MIEINPQKIVYERVSTTQTNPGKIVKNVSSGGDFIFRGGLALQAELGAQNVRQFGRFLRTPRGARFIAQQFLLQGENPQRRKNIITPIPEPGQKHSTEEVKTTTLDQQTRLYNPGAPLLAKALPQELSRIKPNRHFDFSRFGNPIEGVTDKAVRFFDKNKGIGAQLQVRYGGDLQDPSIFPDRNTSGHERLPSLDRPPVGGTETPERDFIKFRIRDAVNGKYIIFPALLEGNISDNSSTTPTESSYIGRADKVYVYGNYTRTISFAVNIVALNKKDVPIIWEKVNAAKGLVLPSYERINELGGAPRPTAPVCYLTLGDLFNNAPGLFTSVNLAIPEGSTWELSDGRQVPHICTLSFEFTYIGTNRPSMTSDHYDNIADEFPLNRELRGVQDNSVNGFKTKYLTPEELERNREQQRQQQENEGANNA